MSGRLALQGPNPKRVAAAVTIEVAAAVAAAATGVAAGVVAAAGAVAAAGSVAAVGLLLSAMDCSEDSSDSGAMIRAQEVAIALCRGEQAENNRPT